jgi:hypothetical protein
MNLFDPGLWETASYVVTVVGLPVAIAIFIADQRKQRRNEEEESWQRLSDAYNDFLQVVIDHPDLRLRTGRGNASLTPEQEERMMVIFTMLIGLFERAYLVAWEPAMTAEQARRWNSWEDWMREWCRRRDFSGRLPELLRGEDPDFAAYIRRIAEEEAEAAA